MKASEAEILFIPGHLTAADDHWQSRWQAKLSSARLIPRSAEGEAMREDWVGAIVAAVQNAEKPVVLVAHSLGIVAAIQALPLCGNKIAGAFLVSPPDLESKSSVGSQARKYGDYPRDPLPFPSILVASNNDPHGSLDHAGDLANAWGSMLVEAGPSGHIDAASGHGPWPEGTMVFSQFLSRLKP